MKIVITGGTGFLGRHLVWRAAASGAEVVFTGRSAAAADEVIHHAPGPVRWQPLVHGDTQAADILTSASKGADAIIHCSALSSPWGTRDAFLRANVAGTAEVLTACHTAGIARLVHISTPSIYFGFRDRLDIRESAPLPRPANDYVRTKLEAERLVRTQPPPEAVILRPRALFGPWDQTLVPRLLRVMAHGPLPLMRGGRAVVDMTYIDNAVDAAWSAATGALPRPLATYNVSNGEPWRLLDILTAMAREFGLPLRTRRLPWPLVGLAARALEGAARLRPGWEPPLTRYGAGVLTFSQTLNIDAARKDLGYRPAVGVADGIRHHALWWRARHKDPGR